MRRFLAALALSLLLPSAAFATSPAQVAGQALQSAQKAPVLAKPEINAYRTLPSAPPGEATSVCMGDGCAHQNLMAAKAGFCDLENPNFYDCLNRYRAVIVRADPDKPAADGVYTVTLTQGERTESVTTFTATHHARTYRVAGEDLKLTTLATQVSYEIGGIAGEMADFRVGQTRTVEVPNGTLTIRYREFLDPSTAQARL